MFCLCLCKQTVYVCLHMYHHKTVEKTNTEYTLCPCIVFSPPALITVQSHHSPRHPGCKFFFFVGYIFCFSTFSCLHFYSPPKVRRSGLLCACLLSGVKNLPCFPADRKTQHALSAASCSGLSGQWGSFAYRHRAGQWLKNTHNVFTVQPGCQS